MSIQSSLTKISNEFAAARQEGFKGHPLASFIRNDWVASVSAAYTSSSYPSIKVSSSPGKGQWNESPWLALLDERVTSSAQSGYYPVYLFEPGMRTCCLVLAQGAYSVEQTFGSKEALKVVSARAQNLRTACTGWQQAGFTDTNFQTVRHTSSKSQDDPWSRSVAFGKRYHLAHLPTENELQADVRAILDLYSLAVSSIGTRFTDEDSVSEDLAQNGELPTSPSVSGHDGAIKISKHKSLEKKVRTRNKKLINDIKKLRGSRCQGCSLEMTAAYPKLEKSYIEAHHLTPLSESPDEGTTLTADDFALLCPNCHKAIHQMGCPTLQELRDSIPAALRSFNESR